MLFESLDSIGNEGHGLARNIKESIFIRVNNPTFNNNIGKFNLPNIWVRVLLNTPGLTLKRHAQVVGQANSHQPNILSHLNQPNILCRNNYPDWFLKKLTTRQVDQPTIQETL